MKWAGLYQHIFHMKWVGLYQHIFHLNGLDFTCTFFIQNWLNSLAHCSFQIGLDSSDSSFLFQGKKSKAARSGTQLGSILRIITSYFILFSFPSLSIKRNHGSSRPKFHEIREARRIVPHFMQSSACLCADLVLVSASCVSARSSEQIVRMLWRAHCPRA